MMMVLVSLVYGVGHLRHLHEGDDEDGNEGDLNEGFHLYVDGAPSFGGSWEVILPA
jgi:hypothetical protein